jgi:hypothetical protein
VTGRLPARLPCARCRRPTARQNLTDSGGLLYGPCCLSRAVAGAAWLCASCGGLFCEQDMAEAGTCRFCAVPA